TMNANAVAISTQTTKIVLSAIERDSLKFMCLSSSPRVEPESNCSTKGCEPYKKLRPSIVRTGSDAPSSPFPTWIRGQNVKRSARFLLRASNPKSVKPRTSCRDRRDSGPSRRSERFLKRTQPPQAEARFEPEGAPLVESFRLPHDVERKSVRHVHEKERFGRRRAEV